jgi:nucleotide-binding universal stress UspA family protein
MRHDQTAYLPLTTYPEAPSDAAVLAAIGFARVLGCKSVVSAFAVDIPPMPSPLGGLLLDVQSLVRTTESKSKADCLHLQNLVRDAIGTEGDVNFAVRTVLLGAALDEAAEEARMHDLAVIPWSPGSIVAQDMAQAVIFGSSRPTVLVPETASLAKLTHVAIAWDGSRVATRALWDALGLLRDDGRLTVLTVRDEKPLDGPDVAHALASALHKRGLDAKAIDIALGGKSIAIALQEAAIGAGAQMLAMGGFGHSRIRDFVLGGATKGVMHDLRLPVMLSH